MNFRKIVRAILSVVENDNRVLRAILTPMPLQTGTVVMYDWLACQGTIKSDKDNLTYTFASSSQECQYHLSYYAGDQVHFRVTQGCAVEVHAYARANSLLEWWWCEHCQRYVRYANVRERMADGDWGEYMAYFCRICRAEINSHDARGFKQAYWQYEAKKMSPQQTEVFKQLLNTYDSEKMLEFLESWNFPVP